MNTQEQIIWQLANEHGCRCEICKAGIWLKQLEQLVSLPSYLVLYHKNGDKDNYNLDNIVDGIEVIDSKENLLLFCKTALGY